MTKLQGYKKYMKKERNNNLSLVKLFIVTFCVVLLCLTFIMSNIPQVDTSIGGDKIEQADDSELSKENIDSRLAMIKEEDQGSSFSDLMKRADEKQNDSSEITNNLPESSTENKKSDISVQVNTEPLYKVYIGNYTSAEHAKVTKDIIAESGSSLNIIVKCLGTNSYTLQAGTFKNKQSADALLKSILDEHLPGRIETEF